MGNQFLHYIIFLVSIFFTRVIGDPKFPCYFIFGDSLFDVGNNNRLRTGAKVNFLPYGVDFPQGPTGRFSNGLNVADYIAKDLGFHDYIPAYASVKRKDVLTGVNYASGGSGILDETGENLGERISFNKQILHHEKVISLITTQQRNQTYTKDYCKKCLYAVQIGNNDYINNYFAPTSHDKVRHNVTVDQFATTLINRFSQQLNASILYTWLIVRLFKLGARKFAVFGIGEVGCTPAQMRLFGTPNTCVTEMNDAVNVFNAKQRNLIDDLNRNLKDAKFVVIDVSNPTSGLLQSNGTVMTKTTCCKVSSKGDTRGQCIPRNVTCLHRNKHWFYDGFHPTQYANRLYAKQAMLTISKLL
ncbi:hypothetical protein OSB04_012745 [Centaurea solstitialis]|uniref:GDSL esterase/lipase n=1 Tax=Centaurea solstitialis TaxID=347529 RepID=A0AA38TMK1_9ASTR|nr:hypothetical protein OSB04_012745 [Centaurea solstitialis]